MAKQSQLIHSISFTAHWPEVTLLERQHAPLPRHDQSAMCATAINDPNECRLEDQFYLC